LQTEESLLVLANIHLKLNTTLHQISTVIKNTMDKK